MKKLFALTAIALLFGCATETTEPTEQQVVFSTDYLSVQSGQLKSFDMQTWKHFYWPFAVSVEIKSVETGAIYHTNAANSYVFFTEGSEPTYLPSGKYICHVNGGGWVNSGNAFPYFVWSVKDTIVNITPETGIIRFELENIPALIVKDAEAPIELKGIGLDSVEWTGNGNNDFVYVTAPWPYAASANGKFIDIEAKPEKYYYLKISPDTANVGGTVELPVFEGDTVKI